MSNVGIATLFQPVILQAHNCWASLELCLDDFSVHSAYKTRNIRFIDSQGLGLATRSRVIFRDIQVLEVFITQNSRMIEKKVKNVNRNYLDLNVHICQGACL